MSVLVGRVGLVVKGAWDSSVAYATMDVVTYNNSTYIAKQAVPAGTLPTNTTYWEPSLDASLLATKVAGATSGNFAGLDENGNITDSGHKHSDYVTDVSGKADKVTGATSGNFAGLDVNGNLVDSGWSYAKSAVTTIQKTGLQIAEASICAAVQFGKLVHLNIAGSFSSSGTTRGDIFKGLPPVSSVYQKTNLQFYVQSGDNKFPLSLSTLGIIGKASDNPTSSGWYVGNITYFTD